MSDEFIQIKNTQPNVLDVIPHGFKRVGNLGELADLKIGLSYNNSQVVKSLITRPDEPNSFYLLSHKNILLDGCIDLENTNVVHCEEASQVSNQCVEYLLKNDDILISRILTKTNVKIGLVSNISQKLIVFEDSIIRVRVNSSRVDPISVFEFLRSDTGFNLLKNYASSLAGMPRISLSGLANTPVFIPDTSGKSVDELNFITVAVQRIKNDILPVLENIEPVKKKSNNSESTSSNSQLSDVASKLRELASYIVPPSLRPVAEKVMDNYPTPIALAYRRFHDSRFNVYEQVQRLIDVFELTSYFVYNLVLSDILQRLDPKLFCIKDSGARRAYNTFAMSRRIDAIKEIVEISRLNNGVYLFIPELLNSSFIEPAEKLKDLRNELSHAATASESRQHKILDEYKPIVEKFLSELEFLTDYRLVRIPFLYRQDGQIIYRMEVYQGTVPHLNEQKKDSELEGLQLPEHNHLVMLNNVGNILDLYPLCQIVNNEETQYEKHICFLKQCESKKKKLVGESIQNCKMYSLEGFDVFENMIKIILDK